MCGLFKLVCNLPHYISVLLEYRRDDMFTPMYHPGYHSKRCCAQQEVAKSQLARWLVQLPALQRLQLSACTRKVR